ncbi:5775_t:CDS:2 [Diversispora eburnea]|uniref:Protein farnesyltransferase/geranylgeranyltransferase type-1 subunit alpha n=1 Tax=Diversispora eburnea TaxID=1213867 RepID=A0A9N9B4Q0_9GLOM|nr:5775_t:CDS:2 [Diversispora eburnea]
MASYYLEANWDDLVPIPQDDGPEPLTPISYDKECYSEAMSYFRAVALKDERSERALSLTEKIIKHNPAHYTIWHYRQQILFSLEKDLYNELDFITDQWIIKTYNLWDKELAFIDKLLDDDVRNNSAWNQRYFVIFFNPNEPTEELLAQEVQYGINKILLAPNNISPWNYVKGIIAKSKEQDISVLEGLCKELEKQNIISYHALGCLVDIYESRAKRGSIEDKNLGIKTCELLAEKRDNIRQKYWEYRKQVLT